MFCPDCGTNNKTSAKFCVKCGCELLDVAVEDAAAVERKKEIEPGTCLDKRYQIIGIIERGGMGAVYKAIDLRLDIVCAVKEMRENFERDEYRIYAIEKFKDEALILSKLRHSNIPRVSDYFIENNRYYIIMDYIEGETLFKIVNRRVEKRLDEQELTRWTLQLCDVFSYLHQHDPPIIYRDVKPANIMINRENRVMLIDFGIARIFSPQSKGTMIGTQGYSPPEQYRGKVEPRSDLYALGATLHHLVTGKDPQKDAPFSFQPLKKLRPEVSDRFSYVIDRCLKFNIDERFNSAEEIRDYLTERVPLPVSLSPLSSPISPKTDDLSSEEDKVGKKGSKAKKASPGVISDLEKLLFSIEKEEPAAHVRDKGKGVTTSELTNDMEPETEEKPRGSASLAALLTAIPPHAEKVSPKTPRKIPLADPPEAESVTGEKFSSQKTSDTGELKKKTLDARNRDMEHGATPMKPTAGKFEIGAKQKERTGELFDEIEETPEGSSTDDLKAAREKPVVHKPKIEPAKPAFKARPTIPFGPMELNKNIPKITPTFKKAIPKPGQVPRETVAPVNTETAHMPPAVQEAVQVQPEKKTVTTGGTDGVKAAPLSEQDELLKAAEEFEKSMGSDDDISLEDIPVIPLDDTDEIPPFNVPVLVVREEKPAQPAVTPPPAQPQQPAPVHEQEMSFSGRHESDLEFSHKVESDLVFSNSPSGAGTDITLEAMPGPGGEKVTLDSGMSREEESSIIVEPETIPAVPAFVPPPAKLSNSNWFMARASKTHTARNPRAPLCKGQLKWRFRSHGRITASACFDASGTIYFGSNDGCMYAITQDGKEKWRYLTDNSIVTTPLIVEGQGIYFGSEDSIFYAINFEGKEMWRKQLGSAINSSAVADKDGNVYVGCNDGNLYSFNIEGEERWRYPINNFIQSSPALGNDGILYVGSWDKHLYAISTSGVLAWKFASGGAINTSPVIDGAGCVYFGSEDNYFYAIDYDGRLKWKYRTKDQIQSSAAIDVEKGIFFGCNDNFVYNISFDGHLRWRARTNHWVRSSPALDSECNVYIGSDDFACYCISYDGKIMWKFKTNQTIESAPCIDDNGVVYFGSNDGWLYALE